MEPSARLRNGFKLLRDLLQASLNKTLQQEVPLILNPVPNKPKEDYVCPSAVRVFNQFKKDGSAFGFSSAKDMAASFVANLDQDALSHIAEPISVNNAGFLSIKVKDSYMENEINKILRHGVQVAPAPNEKVLVDFSSPNIAKQMHVGHLRSTILGESICRLLEFKGQDVHRVNHLGDWGTQFGMLIEYIKHNVEGGIQEDKHSLEDILEFYKASKKCFDNDPEFKKRSQYNVTQLQGGEKESIAIWELLTKITMRENDKLYERMDIKVFPFGESYYNKMLAPTVQELKDKGLVKEDEGAQCLFMDEFSTPLIVVKKDGGYNYDSTDMAAIKHRIQTLGRNRVLVVTDMGQAEHFKKIFRAAEMAGWANGEGAPQVNMQHVGFGLVQGADGKKFKSRDGDTVKLQDLVDQGVALAKEDLLKRQEKQEEGQITNLDNQQEVDQAAERVGISAIKYFDLRQSRTSDYRFDYAKMLDNKGNTAVYLFYSYVRICSILQKSGLSDEQLDSLIHEHGFQFTHNHEKLLGQLIVKFAEYVDAASEDLELHKLCDYVYLLTVKVAEGYSKYRILEQKETNQRILLCLAIKRILDITFHLLGMRPVSKI